MNRRTFLGQMLASLPIAPTCFASTLRMTAAFTSPTKYINSEHPNIRTATQIAVGDAISPVERAIRIHDFVRDRVAFGWASRFYDQTASEILQSGIGYCNTKGTLMVAMLRAAGIPARQHFVDIHASILAPYIDPGTAYVDHSFTEVLLQGRWVAVDSYIVDKPLFVAAKKKLTQTSKVLGFGVHLDGTCDWDGQNDAFAQFLNTGRFAMLSTNDHGLFEDVAAFYASGTGVNKLNPILRLGFGLFVRSANQRIATLRSAA